MPDFLHGVEVLQIDNGARAIRAPATSVIGVVGTAPTADVNLFPLDTPVLITRQTDAAGLTATLAANAAAGAEGTLPLALAAIFDQCRAPIVVVRVAVAPAGPTQLVDQLSDVAGDGAASTGVYALLAAEALTKVKPKILCAPGWTHQTPDGDANAVAAALKAVADKLRAVAVIDGPNDTDAAAIDKAEEEGGERVYLVDPHTRQNTRTGVQLLPASGQVAGVIARTDAERGFWWSPSNQPINGVLGLGRLTDFSLTDPGSGVNLMNAAGVGTIIAQGGYRLWGNRTAAADQAWAFLSVRRTADSIYEAIEASYLWALDRPVSGQLVGDVVQSVEAYLRSLRARGAILGGRAWVDPDLNTPAALKSGQLFINFDFEPPAPLERLTFSAHRQDGYYAEVISAAVLQAA